MPPLFLHACEMIITFFRPMAVLALGTILTAGICVIVQGAIDLNDHVIDGDENGLCDMPLKEGEQYINSTSSECTPNLPPPSAKGAFTAFSSIMFAFGGASTLPTIQADMKERSKFPIAALLGCGGKLVDIDNTFIENMVY